MGSNHSQSQSRYFFCLWDIKRKFQRSVFLIGPGPALPSSLSLARSGASQTHKEQTPSLRLVASYVTRHELQQLPFPASSSHEMQPPWVVLIVVKLKLCCGRMSFLFSTFPQRGISGPSQKAGMRRDCSNIYTSALPSNDSAPATRYSLWILWRYSSSIFLCVNHDTLRLWMPENPPLLPGISALIQWLDNYWRWKPVLTAFTPISK